MKIIGTFGGVVIASMAMLQPVEAGHRGSGRSLSSGFHRSGGARTFTAPTRTFSNSGGARFNSGSARFHHGGARFHNSSARFSSGATFRNRSFPNSGPRVSGGRTNRFDHASFNPRGGFRNRTHSGDRRGFDGNRSSGFRNRGFNNNNTSRIVGHRGRNWNRHWDKRRDHYWRGHRCRWVNNSWVIFATGFYPYGYGYYPYSGYYPYGGYSYYDDRYYDDRHASNEERDQSEYDDGATDSNVSEIQSALSRAGYYSGAVDGTLGPETRNALRRYQRDRGLPATGQINRATMNALGLR